MAAEVRSNENEMEQLEDKVRLLKLQEEKAGLMRKDVMIEERLCDVKVLKLLLFFYS